MAECGISSCPAVIAFLTDDDMSGGSFNSGSFPTAHDDDLAPCRGIAGGLHLSLVVEVPRDAYLDDKARLALQGNRCALCKASLQRVGVMGGNARKCWCVRPPVLGCSRLHLRRAARVRLGVRRYGARPSALSCAFPRSIAPPPRAPALELCPPARALPISFSFCAGTRTCSSVLNATRTRKALSRHACSIAGTLRLERCAKQLTSFSPRWRPSPSSARAR